jgi:murein DD-endopeptidase MepM/ murein hydrolase activator NlpD
MGEMLRVIIIVGFALSSLILNMNISTYARSSKFLKEDLEIALHDAAISPNAIDESKLSNGEFVFDKAEAKQIFQESFESNTGISSTDYKILKFEAFDDSNSSFPVTYKPSDIKFEDTFDGPTIIAVIETDRNKYFFGTQKQVIRRLSSYTYKKRNPTNSNVDSGFVKNIYPNKNDLYWTVPFTQNVTSHFDPDRIDPVLGVKKAHNGMDISAPGIKGQPVVATKDGKVIFSGNAGTYGNLVMISHGDGLETRYAHLNSLSVTTGQEVNGGQIIGTVGTTGLSTGDHLHFEMRYNGTPFDPFPLYQ